MSSKIEKEIREIDKQTAYINSQLKDNKDYQEAKKLDKERALLYKRKKLLINKLQEDEV